MAKAKRRIRSAVVAPKATPTEVEQIDARQEQGAEDEPLVGPIPVAIMLGVPVSWVYSKSETGDLPSYKLGHYRRFRPSEVRDYVRERASRTK